MKTQIVIMFDRKQFDSASDFLGELLIQFTMFAKKRYVELYYQMPLPFEEMVSSWSCPVEAPVKQSQGRVVMPVEREDGEMLL